MPRPGFEGVRTEAVDEHDDSTVDAGKPERIRLARHRSEAAWQHVGKAPRV